MAGAVGPLSPWGAGRVKEDRAGLPVRPGTPGPPEGKAALSGSLTSGYTGVFSSGDSA